MTNQSHLPVAAPVLANAAEPKVNPNPAPTVKPSPVAAQLEIPEKVDAVLSTILSWPRPHDSVSEKMFCEWLKTYLSGDREVTLHSEGAMSVTIACADGKPSATLFSCHVDTVDGGPMKDYGAGASKKVLYDPNFGTIFLDKDSIGTCLGADDGAGVWIMLKMIEAAVPGTYLFHRGEEKGGISAKAIATKEAPWIKQFDLAIAFDRPRNNEVITHQGSVRCASDKFANALCEKLNAFGFDYKPSDRGFYTDTKEYRKLVSECINLGVGYESQHTKSETLDYAHLSALLAACIEINWDALPAEREPSEVDVYAYSGSSGYRGNYGSGSYQGWSQRDLDDFDHSAPLYPVGKSNGKGAADSKSGKNKPKQKGTSTVTPITRHIPYETDGELLVREMEDYTADAIAELCASDPDSAYQVILTLIRQKAAMQAEIDTLLKWVR